MVRYRFRDYRTDTISFTNNKNIALGHKKAPITRESGLF